MTTTYAWIIDQVLIQDLSAADPDRAPGIEDTGAAAIGKIGPAGAPAHLRKLLAEGHGRPFRTLLNEDFDGQPEEALVRHVGRYLDWYDVQALGLPTGSLDPITDVEHDTDVLPLHDLGDGVIAIQYLHDDGTWKTS